MRNNKTFPNRAVVVVVVLTLLLATVLSVCAEKPRNKNADSIKLLNRNTSKMLTRVGKAFPELVNDRGEAKDDTGIFLRLYYLLKGLAGGSIQPLQIISNTTTSRFVDVKDVHKYLEKPTLIAVIANELPKRRTSILVEPHLFKLGKSFRDGSGNNSKSSRNQLEKSILSRIILPYMNRMGEMIEKRSGKHLYPITLERLPNHLTKHELVAVWDMGSGRLFIHNAFYDQFISNYSKDDFGQSIPEESLIEFYETILKSGIPTDFTKEGLLRAIRQIPETLAQMTARPSVICLACLIVLSLFMPFLVNYVCYFLAQAICAALKLPFDICIDVEVGSLILAFILTFPTALFVWKLCHATVCGKSMGIAYKTGMMTLAAGFVYIQTMFGNVFM